MAFKPVILWTDALVYLLVAVIVRLCLARAAQRASAGAVEASRS